MCVDLHHQSGGVYIRQGIHAHITAQRKVPSLVSAALFLCVRGVCLMYLAFFQPAGKTSPHASTVCSSGLCALAALFISQSGHRCVLGNTWWGVVQVCRA